ncbi:MAG: hypothetical protein RI897_1975 [Verrucomicrobiota bacterium]
MASAIEEHGDGVAGAELVGIGEGFTDEDLSGLARGEPLAGAEVEAVERGGVEVGEGADHAAGGFIEVGDIERDLDGDTGLDRGDPWDGRDTGGDGVGGAFEVGEDLGEAVGIIVGLSGGFERVDEATGHDHHGEAAAHDEGDGEGLAFDAAEVAPEFTIEGVHGYQLRLLAGAGVELVWRLWTWPSEKWITRSAISAMMAL